MTPEGKVKALVKKELTAAKKRGVYWHMPVQNGMGSPTLDFVGCARGRYFAIETKAPGGKPTTRQNQTAYDIVSAGGVAFLIDGPDALSKFAQWLREVVGDYSQADEVRRVGGYRLEDYYFYPPRASSGVQGKRADGRTTRARRNPDDAQPRTGSPEPD